VPITLDATVGGPNANSFITVARAIALLEVRLFTSAFVLASDVEKQKASLIHASSILNRLPWMGIREDGAQALNWPRAYCPDPDQTGVGVSTAPFISPLLQYIAIASDIIPLRIELATALLALGLIGSATDPFLPVDTANIKSERVGPLATEYVDPKDLLRGFDLFPEVWALIEGMVDTSGRWRVGSGVSGATSVRRG
jgi:hypothetical protein